MEPSLNNESFFKRFKIQSIVGIPVLAFVAVLLFSSATSPGVMSLVGPKLLTLVIVAYAIYFWLSSIFSKFIKKRSSSTAATYFAHLLAILIVVIPLILILSVRVSVM